MTDDPDAPASKASGARSHGRLKAQASARPQELMTDRPTLHDAWTAKVVTLFPELFPGVLGVSLTGKALDQGLWNLEAIDLRRFGQGKHRNVDDTPAGGGAGMVLRADVLGAALDHAAIGTPQNSARWPLVLLSPRGRRFDQATAREWAQKDGVTLVCGRFEGVDQRVIDHYGLDEVSLGDFVMTGGEIAAQAMIDACVRLIPKVLGNDESAEDESFTTGLLEYPQYTKPAIWNDHPIPPILTSGHHGEIEKWRRAQAERLTRERRPDLWAAHDTDDGSS